MFWVALQVHTSFIEYPLPGARLPDPFHLNQQSIRLAQQVYDLVSARDRRHHLLLLQIEAGRFEHYIQEIADVILARYGPRRETFFSSIEEPDGRSERLN